MKTYIIVIIILINIIPAVSAKSVSKYGQLSVEGAHIVDSTGSRVILKGISLGWHNWWPQYYNPSVVKYLSDSWNISVIRAAMGIEHDGGYLEKPENSVALIKTVIDAAIANDIYVIIDWHTHKIHTDEAITYFSTIAKQYAGFPNIIYEIFNEPEEGLSWDDIKTYSMKVIDTIRKYDRYNLIIVGTPTWSKDLYTVANDPILNYDNIVYSLHFYAASHKACIRQEAIDAVSKGLPIFISECSPAEASGDGLLDKKEFSKWMEFLKHNDIGFVMWGLYDKNETTAMLKYKANPDGKWNANQLTEMGIYSRKIVEGRKLTSQIRPLACILFIMIIIYFSTKKIKKSYF